MQSLFLHDKEFAPSVLGMVFLRAVFPAVHFRLALAVAFSCDPRLGDSFRDHVLDRSPRPPVRKAQVVLVGTPAVGVPLDHDFHGRVALQHLHQLVKLEGTLARHIAPVKLEVDRIEHNLGVLYDRPDRLKLGLHLPVAAVLPGHREACPLIAVLRGLHRILPVAFHAVGHLALGVGRFRGDHITPVVHYRYRGSRKDSPCCRIGHHRGHHHTAHRGHREDVVVAVAVAREEAHLFCLVEREGEVVLLGVHRLSKVHRSGALAKLGPENVIAPKPLAPARGEVKHCIVI